MTETLDLIPDAPRWFVPHWVHGFGGAGSAYLYRRADLIRLAENDGIPQVAPILAVFNGAPNHVKARIGKGLWRRVHHSKLEHNVWRAKAKLFTRLDFVTIMAVPPGALPETVGQCKASGESAVRVAAYIATNRTEMREAVMLARDTIRMGGYPSPQWSLRRLREEHDRLSYEVAGKTASATEWAPAWSGEFDGYRFRRLISHADFAIEGKTMRHCIASYANRAKRGDETAFSIDGPERASVSFSRSGWVEIKGRYNRRVSPRCRAAADMMWKTFREASR